jgi:acyl transferase domain-containing protein
MVSSLTGQLATPKALATPQYWVENLISPVRYSDAVQRLADFALPLPPGVDAITDVIEVGPHSALRRPTKDSLSSLPPGSNIRYHGFLQRNKPHQRSMASLFGTLFCHGYPVNIAAVNEQAKGNLPFLIDCPPYPFDHSRRYWNEGRLSKGFRLRPHSTNHLLGRRNHDWNPLQPRWRNWQCVETMPWLAHHAVSAFYFLLAFFSFSLDSFYDTSLAINNSHDRSAVL